MTNIREHKKALHRQKIIEATLDSIAQFGFSKTTVSTVIKFAGLSRGMINLHFNNKDDLYYSVLCHLSDQYQSTWQAAIKDESQTAENKINTLIEVDLSPEVLNERNISNWVAFRADISAKQPRYMELYDTRDEVHSKFFEELLEELGAGDRAAEISYGINTLIEGFWMDFYLHPNDFDRKLAVRICKQFIGSNIN